MAAFIACLVLQLEIGILAGIAINIIFILYHAARPKISIEFLSVSFLTRINQNSLQILKNSIFINFLIFFKNIGCFLFSTDKRRYEILDADARSLSNFSVGGLCEEFSE